jgi:hypothetical protein
MNKYKIGKTYKKTIPLNTKKLGTKIKDYPFVEISWLDLSFCRNIMVGYRR